MTKPWIERTREEDEAEARRKRIERIDYELSTPGYRLELEEQIAAEKARMQSQMGSVDTIETALYAHEKHVPSRRMLRWEARRGLRNEEEFYS